MSIFVYRLKEEALSGMMSVKPPIRYFKPFIPVGTEMVTVSPGAAYRPLLCQLLGSKAVPGFIVAVCAVILTSVVTRGKSAGM